MHFRSILATVTLFLCLSTTAFADDVDLNTDYMSIMISSAVSGDVASGTKACEMRSHKIALLGNDTHYTAIDFQDLYLLSKLIYAEAGSSWLSDEWKMSVGEVVLNRVESPEFPDSISEVIYQSGQYYSRYNRYFRNLTPDERCVKLAVRLLEGERNLAPTVVFQANFTQGGGVHTAYYDRYLGWTYLCYSSRSYLY